MRKSVNGKAQQNTYKQFDTEDFLDKPAPFTRSKHMVSETAQQLMIGPATPDDLDTIERIEQRAYPFPWSREVLGHAVQSDEAFSYFYVARLQEVPKGADPIIGYHHFWLVADEVHILNIAIDPVYQRRGYASRLLQFALDFGRERGASSAFLEVRASNRAAQQLYAHFGFERIDVRKAYYSDNQEDAYVMKKQRIKMSHHAVGNLCNFTI